MVIELDCSGHAELTPGCAECQIDRLKAALEMALRIDKACLEWGTEPPEKGCSCVVCQSRRLGKAVLYVEKP